MNAQPGLAITSHVALPSVEFRQGENVIVCETEEELCELFEMIEECFAHYDAQRQPRRRAQP